MKTYKAEVKVEFYEIVYCDCEYCQGHFDDLDDEEHTVYIEAECEEEAEEFAGNEVYDMYDSDEYEDVNVIEVEVSEVTEQEWMERNGAPKLEI